MNILRIPPILLFFFIGLSFYSQGQATWTTVMFYNVENLFDIYDDPLIMDDEFLPRGDRRWTNRRFQAKLNSLAKVIANTGEWEPPAVIGLCEIENRYVLERLINQPSVKNWDYKIIHKDSPDGRGIDVAAIYRSDVFEPITYRYFAPVAEDAPIPKTREILYMSGVIAGVDTVHLFFNHWPSRYGGLMETRPRRQQAAARLYQEVQQLQNQFANPKIIIMGDFNDQPDDDSMTKFLNAALHPGDDPGQLYNLSYVWQVAGKGTLKYQSMWYIFDQIIVTGNVLQKQKGQIYATPEDAWIMEAPFLLVPDERHTGMKLFRTYEGFRYTGGYSDHLPVLLRLRYEGQN